MFITVLLQFEKCEKTSEIEYIKSGYKGGVSMKITVLGCWGGYPKVHEASTGYLLEHEGFHLLVDCGSGVLSKLQEYIKPEQLDAVIISHYHADHIADIGVLQHAILIQRYISGEKKTLPIYGHTKDKIDFERLTYKDVTVGIAYNPSEQLEIGPFKISFLETNHPVPCYAMRIEAGGQALVYTADSSFKESFISFTKGAQLLLCECNFYEHMDGTSAGHMNSKDAGTLAEKAGVQQLVLTHLPHFGNIEQLKEEVKKYFQGDVLLAKSGLQLTIN
jgi:ribonuclease BN (tRNA processing enzyme)